MPGLTAGVCRVLLFTALALMAVALAPPAEASAASEPWVVTQLTSNESDDQNPQVSGDRVVWWCDDDDDEIFTWTPAGGVVQVSSNPYYDKSPQISGDRVVWEGSGSADILTWTPTTGRVVCDEGSNDAPQVSDDRIVWPGTDGYDEDIFTWTPDSGAVQLTFDSRRDIYPQVSGDRIVWQGWDGTHWEIFTWTPDGGTVQLSNNSYDDSWPQISGDRIVWAGYNDGNHYDIFTWTPTGGTVQLTSSGRDNYSPQVSGDRVVWRGYDGNDYEIYTWTPDGGTVRLTINSYADLNPQVSGDRVVWQEDGTDWEIYTWTPDEGTVQVTYNTYADLYPQVSGDRVVWQAYDGTDDEVFTAVCAQPNFTGTVIAGTQPDGTPRALSGVTVSLNLITGDTLEAVTADDGSYSFYVPEGGSPQVVSVMMRNEAMQAWVRESDGSLHWFTVSRIVPAGSDSLTIDLSQTGDFSTLPHIELDRIYPSGLVYWNTKRACDQTLEWGVPAWSADRPLELYLYDDGFTRYSYDAGSAAIKVSESDMAEVEESLESTDSLVKNREWHEVGHAVMDQLYGPIEDGSRAMGDIHEGPSPQNNHWGYANGSTGDSLMEGFAEFFACAMAEALGYSNPFVYDEWGSIEGQQFKAWYPAKTWWAGSDSVLKWPQEELALAAVLWDLHDGASNSDQDAIGPTPAAELLGLLKAHKPATVSELAGIARGLWPNAAVDAIYTQYGFFGDTTTPNWLYDQGEVVGPTSNGLALTGYLVPSGTDGRYVTIEANRERYSRPKEPWLNLRLSPVDERGDPAFAAAAEVVISYLPPHEDEGWSYRAALGPTHDLIYLSLPAPLADGTPPTITVYLLDEAGNRGRVLYTLGQAGRAEAVARAKVALAQGSEAYLDPEKESPQVSAGGPYEGLAGTPILLTGTTSVPQAEITCIEWDLDYDGVNFLSDAEGLTATVTYEAARYCLVALRITDTSETTHMATAPVVLGGMRETIGPGWHLIAGGPDSDTGGLPAFAYYGGTYTSTKAASLVFGRGYWVRLPEERSVALNSLAGNLGLHLVAGWNLIGNSTGVVLGLPSGLTAFVYDGAAYQSTSTLEPGEGAWVRVTEEKDIVLEPAG